MGEAALGEPIWSAHNNLLAVPEPSQGSLFLIYVLKSTPPCIVMIRAAFSLGTYRKLGPLSLDSWGRGTEEFSMRLQRNLATACASAAIAISAPAGATIMIVDASSIQGDNVLFNDGVQSGTDVSGHTQSGLIVGFTGSTTNGATLRSNGGQARVEGDLDAGTSNPNDTYLLTSLTFGLASGTFNNVEFNLFGGDATSVNFHVIDDAGTPFGFSRALKNGENFFGFQGIDGQSIRSLSWTAIGGGILDQRQLRLDAATPGSSGELPAPVPEPATWAMMLLGFGAVGFAMRKSRQTERVSYSFA